MLVPIPRRCVLLHLLGVIRRSLWSNNKDDRTYLDVTENDPEYYFWARPRGAGAVHTTG